MQINLDGKKRLWLGFILAAAAVVYLGVALRSLAAQMLGRLEDPQAWQRAAWLEPGNAIYPYQLGRYAILQDRDASRAASYFEAAVARNPHEARYWFELAGVYQALNRTQDQSQALDRALLADPRTPEMAWQAGNFYLVQGEGDKALNAFRVVMENDPGLRADAIDMAWHVTPDVERLLREAIPPRTDLYLELLQTLVSRKEDASAKLLFRHLLELGQPFEAKKIFFYIRYLLASGDTAGAREAWAEMAPLCGLTAYLPTDNLVVNGGFDLAALNDGLDWHYTPAEHVKLALDTSEFHGGHRSLIIHFDGLGVNEVGLEQWIPVLANTTYDFSAYFKAQAIEGAGGPVFLVQDQVSNEIYYTSSELIGSEVWRQVGGSFRTGMNAKLLSLRLVRRPANNAIQGKLWVDDIQLTSHADGLSLTAKSKAGRHSREGIKP